MDATLIASAGLLGLAGAPHCAAMCGAPCAAIGPRGAPRLAFHAARIASYAAAGAVAAASVSALATLTQWSPALRPLWTLLHAAALALGLWLLWHGRQPAWMARIGRVPAAATAAWRPVRGPQRPSTPRLLGTAGAGLAWAAWPCGLLQSALLVAALANGAAGGAAAMATFAVASLPGLVAAPWLLHRLHAAGAERIAVRAAGVLLMLGSSWALGHGLWQRFVAWCGLG